MEIVTIDGMVEHDFRLSIEDMLRLNQVDEAIERLRGLLEGCVGDGQGGEGVLPPRFLQVTADYIEIGGWNRLADRLCDHDRARHPISAIGVTLADYRALGGPGIRDGRLAPFIKTFYFNDDGYPFSEATRSDLLDGYSRDGFEWQGDYQATDATLSVRGIDDLYGAIVELEDRLLASPDPGEAEIRAGTIGACYVAALIHQALRDTIRRKGLPRPLCVFSACDGVYPFFDAPVAGSDEYAVEDTDLPSIADDEAGEDSPEDEPPGEASLLSLFSSHRTKAPVMVLCEEDARESARYSEMAGAERLSIDHGHTPAGALEFAHDVLSADGVDTASGAAWAESGLLEPAELPSMTDRSNWVTSSLGMEQPDDERSLSDERDCADSDFDTVPGQMAHTPATDPGMDGESIPVPASHSLRTRIRMAEPDTTDTPGDRLKAMLNALTRMLFGR